MRFSFSAFSRLMLCLLMLVMCASMAPDDAAANTIRKYGSVRKARLMENDDNDDAPPPPHRHTPLPAKHHRPRASKVSSYRTALPPKETSLIMVSVCEESPLPVFEQVYAYRFFEEITPPPPREC